MRKLDIVHGAVEPISFEESDAYGDGGFIRIPPSCGDGESQISLKHLDKLIKWLTELQAKKKATSRRGKKP